jgi:sugar/nucleoside kinase (ribokinase family)
MDFSGENTVEGAADFLFRQTGNDLVITLGAGGCYYREEGGGAFVPGLSVLPGFSGLPGLSSLPVLPVRVADTLGAGDAHCGASIACLKQGMKLRKACERANAVGAAAVGVPGASLDRLPPFGD